ncbi:DUF2946 family protein [Tritonibacter mobilis]|uniref:DUF2946 family protein n=1 Tax=Tritonibacter mobilis TaxID=379347 RepID=UPI001CD9DE7E|nr:DUF2946 family protein [Tritonibacter mobilis]MCA2007775.1 DUF2946 family protein [Tritonibacter mobilis]
MPYLGLLAILIAGLIPAGWMPVTAHDGKVLLVLCTGNGPEERWVDLDEGTPAHGEHEEDESASRNCPFAAQPQLAAHTATQLPLPLMGPERDLWYRAPFTHHSAGFHWRYDARGPPALS